LADWHDDAQNGAPEERATVADLRLWLNEQNVTLHLRGAESIDHVTVSLYGIVEGLVHDWWGLFGGRDQETSLRKYRNGFIVPDLRLQFDGAVFEISAHQSVYRNPDVRFWVGPSEIMDRARAEAQLDNLVETVLERLDASNLRSTSAALRWARVKASRADADEAAFCESAGALGLDPYSVTDRGTTAIDQAAARFEGEPLTEFLAGAAGADEQRLLQWVDAVEGRPRDTANVRDLRDAALESAGRTPRRNLEEGWTLGYRRARALRTVLHLKIADRFRTFPLLARKLGASHAFELAEPVDGLRALRSDHPDGVRLHVRKAGSTSSSSTTHLFSFARAVGDVACFPEEARAPVNELKAAYRQAAGRAFAAEFLAPIDEVRSMRAEGRDSISIANEFGVSSAVIEHQLENQKRIAAVCD
jgi:hypothetical protein